MNIGDRVIAVASVKNNVAEIFGKGTYLGDLELNYEGNRNTSADTLRDAKLKIATIKLDNGEFIYGCECWWGPEIQVSKRLELCQKIKVIRLSDIVSKA